jgi:uroporphyrinogen III methyltransferase/synthase
MAVRWGTRPDQTTIQATLGTLSAACADLKPPATVIIGDVVALRDKLSWFEKLPLHGRQIVVTRAREQASEFSLMLHELGAEVIELPVIQLAPLDDYSALDGALQRLGEYDWLIFTSANAVEYFLQRMDASGVDWRSFAGNLCAIGPATAAALRACHMKVDLMPAKAVAEGLVEAFADFEMQGARVLLPRASAARELVPDVLRSRGAVVDVVDAYRNIIPRDAADRANAVFGGKRKPDWVTFTSSSTVKNLLAVAGPDALEGVRTASIGPATSETLRMHGLPVTAEAREATMNSLIEAILGT